MAVSFVLARLLIVDRIAGDSGDDLVPVGRLFYFHYYEAVLYASALLALVAMRAFGTLRPAGAFSRVSTMGSPPRASLRTQRDAIAQPRRLAGGAATWAGRDPGRSVRLAALRPLAQKPVAPRTRGVAPAAGRTCAAQAAPWTR